MTAKEKRIKEIKERLRRAKELGSWRYEPDYEMFIGTTNAIILRDRVLDLGRTSRTTIPNPQGGGYVLSPQSIKENERTYHLADFLQNAIKDISWLLRQPPAEEKLTERPVPPTSPEVDFGPTDTCIKDLF